MIEINRENIEKIRRELNSIRYKPTEEREVKEFIEKWQKFIKERILVV